MLSLVPAPSIWRSTSAVSTSLKVDIGFARRIGGHRHQVIGATDLHAVAGIIEQADIRTLDLIAEALYRIVELRLVEIELGAATDDRKAEGTQGICHQPGVVPWIVERRDVLVGRVADHQRDALVGKRLRAEARRHHQDGRNQARQETNPVPHSPSPPRHQAARLSLGRAARGCNGDARSGERGTQASSTKILAAPAPAGRRPAPARSAAPARSHRRFRPRRRSASPRRRPARNGPTECRS